ELDKLPACRTIEWAGADRGVIDEVAARRIQFLYWHDAAGEIDLSRTLVTDVRLDGESLRSIRLPRSATTILLRDPQPSLLVDAPGAGHGLDVRIVVSGSDRQA